MAWSLATGAAVTLSWWGVHTVMAGTAYDRPRALPIAADAATRSPAPLSSATRRPEQSASPDKSRKPSGTPDAEPSGRPSGAATSEPPSSPTASASAGNVKGYTVDGGRVVFDLGDTSAELVSATPTAGWQMQVWKQPSWIRVTFTGDGRELSVFCTWHAHPPLVEIYER